MSLGHIGVAQNLGLRIFVGFRGNRCFSIAQVVGNFRDSAINVALDGDQLVFRDLADNARPVGLAVAVGIQEDHVAGDGGVLPCRPVQFIIILVQTTYPLSAVLFIGEVHEADAAMIEVEEQEGHVPGGVGIGVNAADGSVPCAVAVIAHGGLAVLSYLIVLIALLIAQLRFGYGQKVLGPGAGEVVFLREGVFPVVGGFQVCFGVGVAG